MIIILLLVSPALRIALLLDLNEFIYWHTVFALASNAFRSLLVRDVVRLWFR